jgi:hypothetical protein
MDASLLRPLFKWIGIDGRLRKLRRERDLLTGEQAALPDIHRLAGICHRLFCVHDEHTRTFFLVNYLAHPPYVKNTDGPGGMEATYKKKVDCLAGQLSYILNSPESDNEDDIEFVDLLNDLREIRNKTRMYELVIESLVVKKQSCWDLGLLILDCCILPRHTPHIYRLELPLSHVFSSP